MIQMRFPRKEFTIGRIRSAFTYLSWVFVLSASIAFAGGQAAHEWASASSSQSGFAAEGAIDGDRFSFNTNHLWKGSAGQSGWWWQVQFSKPRRLGAILQIQGDHEFLFQNAPST